MIINLLCIDKNNNNNNININIYNKDYKSVYYFFFERMLNQRFINYF
jgi:hypothetical protein